MKNFLLNLSFILFLSIPFTGFSQGNTDYDFTHEVNVVHPPLAISTAQLTSATTLQDLNRHYKSSWVKTYESVEILTTHQGKIQKTVSKSGQLSPEQKEQLNTADNDTEIAINILYLPDNNLKNNELKRSHFSFKVAPENDAHFIGGDEALNKYLVENAIEKLPEGCIKQYALAVVKFTVNTDGKIINSHIFASSNDDEIDALLVETIDTMPNWKPAKYANGLKINQDFVFAIGDMSSCVVNTLNINQIR